MRFINYLLLAVLLTGCGSVFGQVEIPTLTPEQVRDWTRQAEEVDILSRPKGPEIPTALRSGKASPKSPRRVPRPMPFY